MKIGPIRSEMEAERARQTRLGFKRGADYCRDNPPPADIPPEVWQAQANACDSMVAEFDDALMDWERWK